MSYNNKLSALYNKYGPILAACPSGKPTIDQLNEKLASRKE